MFKKKKYDDTIVCLPIQYVPPSNTHIANSIF